MDWNFWIGKKIFVRLKSGKVYSGEVIEISEDGFIKILDKFNLAVVFPAGEILEFKEETGQESGRKI